MRAVIIFNQVLVALLFTTGFTQSLVGMEPSQEELNTNLIRAVSQLDLQEVRKSLAAGADANTAYLGYVPLMYLGSMDPNLSLERQEDREVIRSICKGLFDAGARIDLQNNDGDNALIFAARHHNRSICRLLIELQNQRNVVALKSALLLLHRLKLNGNEAARLLYRQFKALLLPHFELVIPLEILKDMQNNEGRRAIDYLPLYCLIPNSQLKGLDSKYLYLIEKGAVYFPKIEVVAESALTLGAAMPKIIILLGTGYALSCIFFP